MRGEPFSSRRSLAPAKVVECNPGSAAKVFGIDAFDVTVANQLDACQWSSFTEAAAK